MTQARNLSRLLNKKLETFKFTATSGQTTFSDSDDAGNILSYTPENMLVTYNGVVLESGSEYTATNGTSVVLDTGADSAAEVNVYAFESVSLGGYVPVTGGTFGGNVGVTGNLTVDTNTLFVDAANDRVGVGTSSPTYQLHVSGASVPSIINSTNSNLFKLAFADAGSVTGYIGSSSTAPFAVGSSAAAQFMSVDASGNVLVGTTTNGSPGLGVSNSANISFVESTAGTSFATIFRQANSANLVLGSGVRYSSTTNGFASSTNSAWARTAITVGYDAIKFFGAAEATVSAGTDTTLTERMRIDSSGRVTMPGQPMFLGYPSADYSSGGMPTGIMGITALYNNGNHFNAANSRFTAPVTGWYQTTWGGLQLSSAVTSLMKNGSRLRNGNHGVFTGSYVTMTQTSIEYLNAGDYLNIEQWNGGGYFSSWYLWSVTLLG